MYIFRILNILDHSFKSPDISSGINLYYNLKTLNDMLVVEENIAVNNDL